MNITVKIPLRTNKRKRNKINKAIKKQEEVAKYSAEKIRSIPKKEWGGRSTTLNHIVRNKFPQNNGLHYTHYLYKINSHISDIFDNWMKDGFPGESPDFSSLNHFKICNCGSNELTYEENNRKWGVEIPLLKEEKNDYFRLLTGGYQEKLLENYEIKDNSTIVKKDNHFEIHQPIEIPEKNLDYKAKHFLGVDFNFDRLAVIAIKDKEKLLETEFYDEGDKLRHYRDKIDEKINRHQEKADLKSIENMKDKKSRFTRQILHNISADIVKKASQYEKPVIRLENTDIQGMRKQVNSMNKNNFKTSINQWPVGRLIEFIKYKAEKEGIKTELVKPEYTSKNCYTCRKTGIRPYKGNNQRFYCENCEKEVDADFNAAMNIAANQPG